MNSSEEYSGRPSHVCSQCGEWWDVEKAAGDTWLLAEHSNEGPLSVKVWTETTNEPVCPIDTHTLEEFKIE